jgi:hypothetical protein
VQRTLNAQLLEQVKTLTDAPGTTKPSRWFFYKITQIAQPTARKGLLDMLDIGWVEGIQTTRGGPMVYRLYLRCFPNHPVELDEANFVAFDKVWKAFNAGEL